MNPSVTGGFAPRRVSNTELWFFGISLTEKAVNHTVELLVILYAANVTPQFCLKYTICIPKCFWKIFILNLYVSFSTFTAYMVLVSLICFILPILHSLSTCSTLYLFFQIIVGIQINISIIHKLYFCAKQPLVLINQMLYKHFYSTDLGVDCFRNPLLFQDI